MLTLLANSASTSWASPQMQMQMQMHASISVEHGYTAVV